MKQEIEFFESILWIFGHLFGSWQNFTICVSKFIVKEKNWKMAFGDTFVYFLPSSQLSGILEQKLTSSWFFYKVACSCSSCFFMVVMPLNIQQAIKSFRH